LSCWTPPCPNNPTTMHAHLVPAETIQVWLAGRQLAAPNLRWVSQRGRCVCLPSCRSSCRAVHYSKFGAPWFGRRRRRFACPSSHTTRVCVSTEKSTDYRKFLLVGVPNSNYLTKCLDICIHHAQHCTVAHLIELFVVWSGTVFVAVYASEVPRGPRWDTSLLSAKLPRGPRWERQEHHKLHAVKQRARSQENAVG
jgi:hypothetical protein